MKKATIKFTGVYPKFNPETKTTKILYNYVVVSGDSKQYIADKEAEGTLSLQDEGEHKGKPRFVSTKNLGMEVEIDRVTRKDGSIGWFTDNLEQLVMNAEVESLPEFAKAEYGKSLALDAIARAKQTVLNLKAMKATAKPVTELNKG